MNSFFHGMNDKNCELLNLKLFHLCMVVLFFSSMSTAATNSMFSAQFKNSEIRVVCPTLGQGI